MNLQDFMKMQEEAYVYALLSNTAELMSDNGVYEVLYDLRAITKDKLVQELLDTILNTLVVKH